MEKEKVHTINKMTNQFLDNNKRPITEETLYRDKENKGINYFIKKIGEDSFSFDCLSGSVQKSGILEGEEANELVSKLVLGNSDLRYIAQDLLSRGQWFSDRLRHNGD